VKRRGLTVGVAVFAVAIGLAFAVKAASVDGAQLLFNSGGWAILLSPFVGVFAGALTKRVDPHVDGDKVLRHDGAAILEHWTHGLGTAALLITGISLGFLFVPRLVFGPGMAALVTNLHFAAVIFFLFGTFFWATNTLLATKRFKEHLPSKNAIPYTVRHYGLLLGFKKYTMPPEEKYFESERIAFLLAVLATGLVVVTGFVKVAAHAWNVPGAIVGAATLTHDISTILMLAFFLAHIFFAAVLPMSWPMLRSMFTGTVSLEHAKAEHAGWLANIRKADLETPVPPVVSTVKGA
jgi:formate dehydrogenase subunit gamma